MSEHESEGSPQLATSDVARILHVSADRVRQLARRGQLSFTETPYGRLFDRAEVEAFRDRRRLSHRQNASQG